MPASEQTIRKQIRELIEKAGKPVETTLLLADAIEAINVGKGKCSTQYTYLESVKIALGILFDRDREQKILTAQGKYAAAPEDREAIHYFQELTKEMLQ